MNTDYLKRAPRIDQVTYTTKAGEEKTDNVVIIPAIVQSVPVGDEAIRKNSNETPWRLITVGINHPKLGYQERNAQLFEKSYVGFPDTFSKGGLIELMIQLEGEGKGLAKAQLQAIEKIDVDAFAALAGEPVEVTT